MAKAGNISYNGLDTVPNMITGWQVPHLALNAWLGKTAQFWAQQLGSFFPLGFLMPPDHEPMFGVDYMIAQLYLTFCSLPPLFLFQKR
jgi:hypothetical protein